MLRFIILWKFIHDTDINNNHESFCSLNTELYSKHHKKNSFKTQVSSILDKLSSNINHQTANMKSFPLEKISFYISLLIEGRRSLQTSREGSGSLKINLWLWIFTFQIHFGTLQKISPRQQESCQTIVELWDSCKFQALLQTFKISCVHIAHFFLQNFH